MGAPLQLAGQRQKNGFLEAIRPHKDKPGYWDCKCHACGGPAVVYGGYFKSEHTKSCNCLKRKTAEAMGKKHGGTRWDVVPPQSLATRTFGEWKVKEFDAARSSATPKGRRKRFWTVECKKCGHTESLQHSNLTSGHSTECPRCSARRKARHLPSNAVRSERYRLAEKITVKGKTYYSPNKAARYTKTVAR